MTNPNVWAFLLSTVNDKKSMIITPRHSNRTRSQLQTIQKFQNYPDLEIKASDKGGNIVLMTKANYVKMCLNILCNKDWYLRISVSQTSKFKIKYLSIINAAY